MSIRYSPSQWVKIQNVLDSILDLPVEDRLSYLKVMCGGDVELYQHLHELISVDEGDCAFLDRPATALAHSLVDGSYQACDGHSSTALSGVRIGPYLLCNLLGRGGMGLVYRAERDDGRFKQRVAIKVVSEKEKGAVAIGRFRQEQQLLANLDHPNIAKLHDGGFTDDGHAYIVMEYVDGISIDRYCLEKKLSVLEKLKLLLKVIGALRYAHEQLIIHRDIKPSNILVTERGEPKLLDFGIAKLMDGSRLTELTTAGEHVMTPGYAAPEQFKNMPITPATDIFQFGLLFYELLTGKKAFRDKANSLEELVRMISTQEPTAASDVVARPVTFGLQEGYEEPSLVNNESHGKQATNRLIRTLRGDLDAIIAKMLRNNPKARYSSMQQVQSDLKAYFERRPVLARKNTRLYQGKKFIERRWPVLLLSSCFFLITLSYSAFAKYQSIKIQKTLKEVENQRNRAEGVSSFIVNIFNEENPNISGFDKLTVKELLQRGERRIMADLKSPHEQARMFFLMGVIYFSQGDYEKSSELFQSAIVRHKKEKSRSLFLSKTLRRLAESYFRSGRFKSADDTFEDCLKEYKSLDESVREGRVGNVVHGNLLTAFSELKLYQGKVQEAASMLENAVSILGQWKKGQSLPLSVALNNLGLVQYGQGDFSAAMTNFERGVLMSEKAGGENLVSFTLQRTNLALMLVETENFDDAEVILTEILDSQKKMFSEDNQHIATTYRILGFLFYRKKNYEKSEIFFRKSLDIFISIGNNSSVAKISMWLGAALQELKRYSEAARYYDSSIKYFRRESTNRHYLGRVLAKKASLLNLDGDRPRAREAYLEALQLMPSQGVHTAEIYVEFSRFLLSSGNASQAENKLRAALSIREKSYGTEHGLVAETEILLGIVLQKSGKEVEAQALLDKGLQNLKSKSAVYD